MKPTAQDILKLHKTLLDEVGREKAEGFTTDSFSAHCFEADYQIEHFNVKALCKALIVIIENPIARRTSHFEEQLVRLVRTAWTAGFSQPINFQGLEVQEVISHDKVLVLLPKAVRFIMDVDEKEAELQVSPCLSQHYDCSVAEKRECMI